MIKKITCAKIYSKFDMKARFWHIKIKYEDMHKITFVMPHRYYEWNVMPFRLNNALSEFQHIMDKIYKLILDFLPVYINDTLIFSNNEKEHVEHLSN